MLNFNQGDYSVRCRLLEIVLEQSCDIDIPDIISEIIKESGTKTDLSVKYWIF